MESWMPFFVVVTALAIVLQAIILVALFVQLRRTLPSLLAWREAKRRKSTVSLARLWSGCVSSSFTSIKSSPALWKPSKKRDRV